MGLVEDDPELFKALWGEDTPPPRNPSSPQRTTIKPPAAAVEAEAETAAETAAEMAADDGFAEWAALELGKDAAEAALGPVGWAVLACGTVVTLAMLYEMYKHRKKPSSKPPAHNPSKPPAHHPSKPSTIHWVEIKNEQTGEKYLQEYDGPFPKKGGKRKPID